MIFRRLGPSLASSPTGRLDAGRDLAEASNVGDIGGEGESPLLVKDWLVPWDAVLEELDGEQVSQGLLCESGSLGKLDSGDAASENSRF